MQWRALLLNTIKELKMDKIKEYWGPTKEWLFREGTITNLQTLLWFYSGAAASIIVHWIIS